LLGHRILQRSVDVARRRAGRPRPLYAGTTAAARAAVFECAAGLLRVDEIAPELDELAALA
jgi:hypothetical protein